MSEEKDQDYLTAKACGVVEAISVPEAVEGEKKKIPTIDIQAYNGGEILQWWGKTIVDLEGMEVADNVAILANHNPETPIGHAPASAIKISRKGIQLKGGVLSGDPDDPDTRRVLRMSQNGFPWQASIGAPILKRELVGEGEKVKVNGKSYSGPLTIVRASKLKEISVLTMGADDTTSTKVSANDNFHQTQILGEDNMGLEKDRDSLESHDIQPEKVEASASAVEVETLRAQLAESERVRGIEKVTAEHPELQAKAIEGGWSVDQVKASVEEINKVRAERPSPVFSIGGNTKAEGSIEAGFAKTCGIKEDTLRASFGDDALTDAPKVESFSQLAQLKLSEAGKFNPIATKEETLRLAFSTVGLANILSNTANKILLDSYQATPGVSQLLSVERMVPDFKDVSLMDLTMDLTLKQLGTNGEAQHGTVADDIQTGKVDSYARQFVVDRRMLINDDLGAFQSVFAGYGKGAMVAEERNFFSVFTSATPGSDNTGAGSVLSIDALTEAFTDLGNQVDENGDPIDISGALLICPPALMTFAKQLQQSQFVNETTTADTPAPSSNPHAGSFEVVVAPYLNNANVAGGSATRWYLMARPQAVPSFVKMHLIGAPAPVVRQSDLPVGSFGVATDAVYDFGATAVSFKSKGIVRNTGV